MNTILLCGFGKDEALFCDSLSLYGEVFLCKKKTVQRYSANQPIAGTPFRVCCFEQLPDTNGVSGVLLMGRNLRSAEHRPVNTVVPVFEANHRLAAEVLRGANCAAIGCGTSPQDTVSVSSWSEDQISISLQRNLQSLSGKKIEQGEFTLKAAGDCDPFLAAAFCVTLLLCDREGPGFQMKTKCRKEKGFHTDLRKKNERG